MNSANGFQTNVWGAPAWLFLHTVALNYNPERKDMYKNFFESLQGVLPCGACRDNYLRIITNKVPLNDKVLATRESLAFWLFQVHNQVQTEIYLKTGISSNAPKYKDTKEDFRRTVAFYERFRAKSCKKMYGCVVPKHGTKLRTHITIKPFSGARRRQAISIKSV